LESAPLFLTANLSLFRLEVTRFSLIGICIIPKCVISLQKVLYNMETVARTQTAFRIKDSLLERVKWQAKKEHKSVNAFVEETLEEKVGTELVFPKLPPEFFEKAKELDRFAIKGKLPVDYNGLNAAGQAEMDKMVLMDALCDKYGEENKGIY